jgi:hypothetical protein
MQTPLYVLHGIVGFIGVFIPGFLLPGRLRWLGGLLLVGLGSAFYSWFDVWSDPYPAIPRDWPRLLYLAGGGASAVCVHWLLGRLNPQCAAHANQPTSPTR